MKKLIAGFLVLVIVVGGFIGCAPTGLPEPAEPEETSDWVWYLPTYPDLLKPALGEDLSYWDWGTLLPDDPEVLIAEGDGWAAYKRGNFEGYSIVFPLDRAGGLHPPEWSNRLVEVYPDHAIEIIPEGLPEPKGPVGRILDAHKCDDGTYTCAVVHTGVWHFDQAGKVLHRYLDEFNSHESLTLPNGHLLVCTPINDSVREVDWDGNVYWEWNKASSILPYSEQDISNLGADSPFEEPLYLVSQYYGKGSICLNSAQVLPGGHHLLSLRNANLVVELDENNEVIWSFGSLVLKHQHHATKLDNGNVLIHDTCNKRVIEVAPDHEIVWEFSEGMVSNYQGMAQRLPDGNTVITDTYRTIAFCVTSRGIVLWEVYIKGRNTLTTSEVENNGEEALPGFRIYRAWCYPIDKESND